MTLPPDRIHPPISDDTGYLVRYRDLRFLNIAEGSLAPWRAKALPLGLSERQYKGLRKDLLAALRDDGLRPDDCDIRLQGSSAGFFSGTHKQFPRARGEVFDMFVESRERLPRDWEMKEIDYRLTQVWITDGAFPGRRPFDSMHCLGISRDRSDIDLQISSDEIVGRCVAELKRLGQDPTEARIKHPTYNFVKKYLVEAVAPETYLFSLRTGDALNRGVSIAVFPSEGPPTVSDRDGAVSSHFRDSDWLISLPIEDEAAP